MNLLTAFTQPPPFVDLAPAPRGSLSIFNPEVEEFIPGSGRGIGAVLASIVDSPNGSGQSGNCDAVVYGSVTGHGGQTAFGGQFDVCGQVGFNGHSDFGAMTAQHGQAGGRMRHRYP